MRKKAFTVLELLVVIFIIVLLMSMATTAFFSLLNKSHGTQCISNLQQIGYALRQYAQDWKGAYPPVYLTDNGKENGTVLATWDSLLLPYLNPSCFSCPSSKTDLADYWRYLGYNTPHELNYAYNAMLAPPYTGVRKGSPIVPQVIRDPYLTVAIVDAEDIPYFAWDVGDSEKVYDRNSAPMPPVISLSPIGVAPRFPLDPIAMRHENGCNVLLVSGNVKWISTFGYQNAYWEAGIQ